MYRLNKILYIYSFLHSTLYIYLGDRVFLYVAPAGLELTMQSRLASD